MTSDSGSPEEGTPRRPDPFKGETRDRPDVVMSPPTPQRAPDDEPWARRRTKRLAPIAITAVIVVGVAVVLAYWLFFR